MPEKVTLVGLLYAHHFLPSWLPEVVPYTWLVILLLGGLAIVTSRNLSRVPGPLQNALEMAVEGLDSFTKGILGPNGGMFTPLIGTFFLFILGLNLIGLLPFCDSPTSNLNTTVALALVAIVTVHYHALRMHGLGGWLFHLANEPRDTIGWVLVPLMFPLHVIGELARPLSLSLRLFGNIFGEDTVVVVLAGMSPLIAHVLPIPFQVPMLLFAVFGSLIQALVFTMLAAIYISITVGDLEPAHAHH